MKNKKSIKNNYMYTLLYTFFNTALPLLTAPYLSRVVGAKGIGIYAYYYAIVHIFCIIAKLGLTNYGTRKISKAKDKDLSKTFSSIFYQQLLTTLIANIIYFGYCLIFLHSNPNQIYALLLGISLIGTFFDIDWLFSGLESFKKISLRNIFVKTLSVVLIFIFVRNENDLWKYILLMSLGTFIGHISMWISLKKCVSFEKVEKKEIISHLKPNLILVIPVIAISIYRSMDKIMLGNMSVSMTEIGYYENAEKIIYALCGFITAFGTVMMPRISNMVENNKKKEAKKYMGISMQFMMFMMFAMSFGVYATSNLLSVVLFGNKFALSGPLMGLLAMTLPMIGWANVVRSQYVIPNGKDKIYIITVVVGAILNLIVNFICIPIYGSMGAVIGTIIAELSIPITQMIILKNEIPYKELLLKSIPALICAILMFIAVKLCEFINASQIYLLIVKVFVGMISFIIFTFIYIKFFDNSLLEYIKKPKKKEK